MPIRFDRREKVARYLDPRADYQEAAIACEVRRDPLTGRSGRIAHVLGFRLLPVDFSQMIAESRSTCPFCPDRVFAVTPRFPAGVVAEGRIQRGQAVVFPNLAPYDEHSAVTAMSVEHYVPMTGFTRELLMDAFEGSFEYFRQVRRLPGTTYTLAFWNYFPASGGTQIHPHLQLFATDTPGNALEQELAGSLRYYQAEGRPYWADLADEEERRDERFVARGPHSAWMTGFISESLLSDLIVVFPERRTLLDLPDEGLAEFCDGLGQALRHLASQGVYSFNLAWYSGASEREDFWLHARLSPRVYMTPRIWGTDTSALQHLYDEHFMVQSPETAAEGLRKAMRLS